MREKDVFKGLDFLEPFKLHLDIGGHRTSASEHFRDIPFWLMKPIGFPTKFGKKKAA